MLVFNFRNRNCFCLGYRKIRIWFSFLISCILSRADHLVSIFLGQGGGVVVCHGRRAASAVRDGQCAAAGRRPFGPGHGLLHAGGHPGGTLPAYSRICPAWPAAGIQGMPRSELDIKLFLFVVKKYRYHHLIQFFSSVSWLKLTKKIILLLLTCYLMEDGKEQYLSLMPNGASVL